METLYIYRPLNRWHDEVGVHHIATPDSSPMKLLCGLSRYRSLGGGEPLTKTNTHQVCLRCMAAARKRGLLPKEVEALL